MKDQVHMVIQTEEIAMDLIITPIKKLMLLSIH